MTQKEFEALPEDIKKMIPILKQMTHDQKQQLLGVVKYLSKENEPKD